MEDAPNNAKCQTILCMRVANYRCFNTNVQKLNDSNDEGHSIMHDKAPKKFINRSVKV